ncbi:hypothetical protein FIU82_06790 [Pseudoalteromonas sp. THAF3]|uniref:hypothetical protein n=1 Tax=Pseudoalteromonas sp. THAF3 TaxID=2587843 RepID=UPI001267B156|nr:hypothetical protein [Pseudoalteromonas sp. THAF3]MCH2057502.1 hypothetical protein [Thalassotalea sp.]QFU04719.1 hypothetical protein FIU82_06790 [Pseudoalteromonas sp. THAF3]
MANELEYYLSIESDLEVCSRYVELSKDNFATYSVEFAKIIMAASAEIDTLSKEMCKLIAPEMKPKDIKGIGKYAEIILKKHPGLAGIEMVIPRYELSLKPWADWSKTTSPNWWQSNNSIKHDRANNFNKANLENAIGALAGLLALTLYFYLEKNGKLLDISAFSAPRLLGVADIDKDSDWIKGGIFYSYNLP